MPVKRPESHEVGQSSLRILSFRSDILVVLRKQFQVLVLKFRVRWGNQIVEFGLAINLICLNW